MRADQEVTIGARVRRLATAVAVFTVVAGPGCGLGEGESSGGEATLTVTRDYGSELLLEAVVSEPSESETVIRMLDREAEISTRYGGGFVHSIEGVAGTITGGRNLDWFFYVNGVESSTGAAEVRVRGGDRIWWDYRDWTDAMRIPAVVGSWPEPFAQASAAGERLPVEVVCATERDLCDAAVERLADAGIDASVDSLAAAAGDEVESLRLLVGPWGELHGEPSAAALAQEPSTSGVFARFEHSPSGDELVALDERAAEAERIGSGGGLIAALGEGAPPRTWILTGTDERGVTAALELLDADSLADRYAVAIAGEREIPLPAARE